MGTNFYWREKEELVCPCCKRENYSLHIGKSSKGCAFQLRIYPEQNINNLEDWIKLWCNSGFIFDEYGTLFSISEMLLVIMNRRDSSGGPVKHSDEIEGIKRGNPEEISTWDLVSYEFF